MISINVTSDSSLHELKLVNKLISELISFRATDTKSELVLKLDASEVIPMVHEAIEQAKADVFNATEVAEAESLGKSANSTVDVSQSTTAHVDTTVNTSIPTPQSVFGQPVQTNVNVEVPVAPTTDPPVLDAKGRSWDARIHSSAKSFVKDGTWKYKKGVDAKLVDEIEGNVVVPTAPSMTDPENFEALAQNLIGELQTTFPQLLDMVTSAMVAGNLTQAELTEVLNSVGVPALPLLMGKPELIAEVERLLNK